MTVDAGKMQTDLLVSALKALGSSPFITGNILSFYMTGVGQCQYNTANGNLTLPYQVSNPQAAIDKIKQAYSAENVKLSAKKFGWNLQQTGEFKYVLTKR